MVAELFPTRLKREDCKRTKHDSNFSKWEILVAPFDWEDYSLGKEGAERYRIHNLPKISGPGLYELGIAVSHSGLGREIAKLDADRIVVVYLGEADNVRTRLQHYGRSGSHLGNGYLCINDCKIVPLEKGPGLFQEIFLRGYSIVYRWAPMQNKRGAQLTETQLLNTFDYAWNTSGNGARRHNDVLKKLEDIASRASKFTIITRKFLPFRQKQLGIKIKTIKLLPSENKPTDSAEESKNFLSRIFNFSRSRPRLVVDSGDVNDVDTSTCGVTIGNGIVCSKPPVEGRKRCAEHKGMKINGSIRNSSGGLILQRSVDVGATVYGDKDFCGGNAEDSYNTAELSVSDPFPNNGRFVPICGVSLCDGSQCRRQPVQGRKRCQEHKGQRIHRSILISSKEAESKVVLDVIMDRDDHAAINYKQISSVLKPKQILVTSANSSKISVVSPGFDRMCGVDLGNGLSCTRQPVKGRVRCGEHKGMRTSGLLRFKSNEDCKYSNGPSVNQFHLKASVCRNHQGEETKDVDNTGA